MDWRLVGSTFLTIFLAELGDKTQLATLTFAASGSSKWAIFAGSAAALVATSAIAVVGGEALSRVVPPKLLERTAAFAFILLGVWMLWGSLKNR